MSAKDQIKQIVDYFKREPQLKDKTDGMAEGLMLGASLADDANELSKDVQAQVDQLVVNGDSSVEAAQARVDASGKSYTTLKKRLDEKEQETTAHFAQMEWKKADHTYVNQSISTVSGGAIKGKYPTLSALKQFYPEGAVGPFQVEEDNNRYIWDVNKLDWVSIGPYEPAEIADGTITESKLSSDIISVIPNVSNWKGKTVTSVPNSTYTKTDNYIEATYTVSSPTYHRIGTTNTKNIDLKAGHRYLMFTQIQIVTATSPNENVKLAIQTPQVASTDLKTFKISDLSGITTITSIIDATSDFVSSETPMTLFYDLSVGSQLIVRNYGTGLIDITGLDTASVTKDSVIGYLMKQYDVNKDSLVVYEWVYEFFLKIANEFATKDYVDTSVATKESAIDLVLPPIIPVVVGKTMNMWYDNILQGIEFEDVSRVSMDGGTRDADDVWTYTPTSQSVAKTTRCVLQTTGIDYDYDYENNTRVIPVPLNSGGTKTIDILDIGDSRTDQGIPTGELTTLFEADTMSANLLGTRGTSPNKHEGRSGWSAKNYCVDSTVSGVSNPFLNNGIFDFSKYMSNQGYSKVDYVIIQLGKNDINAYGVSTFNQYVNTMINSILVFNPNIKIILTLSESFSNLRKDGNKHRSLVYTQGVIDFFKEKTNVYLSTDYLNVDLVNDFGVQKHVVNPRNQNVTRDYSSDITHPYNGYGKIADCHYYMIKYIESISV